jgi:hypothetical protein
VNNKPAHHYHVPNEQFMNSHKELPLALEACLDLTMALTSPDGYGHATTQEIRTHAFVVRTMLERLKARMETSTWPEA